MSSNSFEIKDENYLQYIKNNFSKTKIIYDYNIFEFKIIFMIHIY